jgi:hypothetical protein
MSSRFAAVAPVDYIEHRLTRIGAHLERLAQGHDPYGHRLDAEERIAPEPIVSRRLTPTEIVDYTRALPRLWADAALPPILELESQIGEFGRGERI